MVYNVCETKELARFRRSSKTTSFHFRKEQQPGKECLFEKATETTMDKLLSAVLITVLSIFTILIALYIGAVFYRFRLRMQYVNMEIGRTEGREQEYWMRQKRKLIHSVFPFYPKHHKKP